MSENAAASWPYAVKKAGRSERCRLYVSKKDSDEQYNNDKRNKFETLHTRLTNISRPSERMGKKHLKEFGLNPKTYDA
jgi:hypothetical protein